VWSMDKGHRWSILNGTYMRLGVGGAGGYTVQDFSNLGARTEAIPAGAHYPQSPGSGANVEMRALVGAEHFFIFGLEADQVAARRADPAFSGKLAIETDGRLRAVIEALGDGSYAADDPGRFQPLVDDLEGRDPFMVTADFTAYWAAQRAIDQAWGDRDRWLRSAVLNTARMGWFSADRTIRGYAREIWGALPTEPTAAPT
jgi:hypothetical protein